MVSWIMADEIVATTFWRWVTAETIDTTILLIATAPFWAPDAWNGIREHRRARTDADERARTDADETAPEPSIPQLPSGREVLKWLVMPRNPLPQEPRERWRLLIILGYGIIPSMTGGRSVGQRVMGLRTVTARDGTRPGRAHLLAGTIGLQLLPPAQPGALRVATVLADLGTFITRPRRPWRDRLTGIVVVDEQR
ncbi:hypothetical protein [Actinomadura sp. 9N407]|uniref:hypothetical protein n=1 Tax=Actinomadura sp. 9N407 TaxID=3375154 RepID=UPI0037B27F03